MKMRMLWFAALAIFLLAAISVHAQGRWELTPFVGYETSGSYPVTSSSIGGGTIPVDRLRANGYANFGAFLDHNLGENFQLEFMWNRNNSSYSAHNILTNSYFNAYHSEIDQFQFGGLYMFRDSEHKLRPYAAASLGFTHDTNSNGNPDRTAFSFSLGGGVKYSLMRHIGLRGDIRYLPTYGSSSLGTYCDPFFGCYNTKIHNYLNRASMVGGIIFRF
jgi:opacity protein-like surface antigen